MQTSNTIMGIFTFDADTRRLFESTVRPLVETHTGLTYVDGASYYEPRTIKMDLISKMIMEARVVIVDISTLSPNVFIELGIAHAMNRPMVFICSQRQWEKELWKEQLPFDLRGRELLVFGDEDDLRIKLGRHISDSLFKTRQVALSWDSSCKANHVKSSSEIAIAVPGRIWSSSAINSHFTVSYHVTINSQNGSTGNNPDFRFYISNAPDAYPCILILCPWVSFDTEQRTYESHIDYFTGTGEGCLTPENEQRYGPMPEDGRYDGRCSRHFRLQQVSVADPDSKRKLEYDVFVSFCWPNVVLESTLFKQTDRLCVSLSSLRGLGYPIHLSQHIGFEAPNNPVSIDNVRVKEVFR